MLTTLLGQKFGTRGIRNYRKYGHKAHTTNKPFQKLGTSASAEKTPNASSLTIHSCYLCYSWDSYSRIRNG